MFCSTRCDAGKPCGVIVTVTLPGGTSRRRNEPFSATPPETYGAFSTQMFADWKSPARRAASVSTVLYMLPDEGCSTSAIQPRTLIGCVLRFLNELPGS